jgi:ABC-type transporter Mla subunit MlaD
LKISNSENLLDALEKSKFALIKKNYCQTISIKGEKSSIPASEYFSEYNIYKSICLNIRNLDTASGTLVGLGLLGTFLGLTLGVSNFDSSSSEKINESIQLLLSGMATAFMTSLLGMGFSLVFTFFDKRWRNKLSKVLYELTEKLDSQYFIDDISLLSYKNEEIVNKLYYDIKHLLDEKLSYTNQTNQVVPISYAIREILAENTEQSKALKSFSTDLAIELNNGFEESLSRQMQQKILPLMENVDNTTKLMIEHIDKLSDVVSSPATDMIQNVVVELKKSMSSLIDEFKTGLSGSATNELESLAKQLGEASKSMADFPQNMSNISSTLQFTIEEIKQAVADISKTSANANSTAMQQMQEQISLATGAISNAIGEVKDAMSHITQSSQQQSNEMVGRLSDAADKMSEFLNKTISSISLSLQNSISNIASDISSKQADLIALQDDTTVQTRKLLDSFSMSIDRLEKMNEYISGTMNMFQQAQGYITGSTAHLQTITGDMKSATQLFNKTQSDYSARMEELQRNNQQGIESIKELLNYSGEMSVEYAEKFEIIKQGLGAIFLQLQNGLTEYSRVVQQTTQKYLDQYSTSLTSTTEALSSTIQQQNEVVEMLVESLNSRKN